jgi:ABC-type sugar transport system ATPase subunit
MIGRTLSKLFPSLNENIGDPVIEINNLSSKRYKNINMVAKKGEVIGIAGLVGAGKTELIHTIFGNYRYESGGIKINGKNLNLNSPLKAIRNNLSLVPDERKKMGLFLNFDITQNITLPSIKAYKVFLKIFINKKKEVKDTNKYIDELNISSYSVRQNVIKLSGGNQQKVVLAKWLLKDSEILIFDEPTRGIDVGAKVEISKIINELSKKGKTILIVSPELEELIGLCHRIYILFEGKLNSVVSGKDKSQSNIIKYMVGEK